MAEAGTEICTYEFPTDHEYLECVDGGKADDDESGDKQDDGVTFTLRRIARGDEWSDVNTSQEFDLTFKKRLLDRVEDPDRELDYVWRCRRRTCEETGGLCLFHAKDRPDSITVDGESVDITDDRLSTLLLDRIRSQTEDRGRLSDVATVPGDGGESVDTISRRRKQFIGSRLSNVTIDLTYESIAADDQYPIDIRGLSADTINWSNTLIGHESRFEGLFSGKVTLSGATFQDELSSAGVAVSGQIWLDDVDVSGGVSLDDADVGGGVTLVDADVSGGVTLDDADVGGEVWLDDADVGGGARLHGADIGGGVRLHGADVGGWVWFDIADVGGEVWCQDVDVGGGVSLSGANVGGGVSLPMADIGHDVSFYDADVGGWVSLIDADVDRRVSLQDADVGGRVLLSQERVGGGVNLEDITAHSPIHLSGFCDGDVEITSGDHEKYIDSLFIEDATIKGELSINGGVLGHRAIRAVPIVESTVSDVSLQPDISDNDDQSPNWDLKTLLRSIVGQSRSQKENTSSVPDIYQSYEIKIQSEDIIFDFKDSTLSDIQIEPDPHNEVDGKDPFKFIRFHNTEFEDTNFDEHRVKFRKTNWEVHNPRDDRAEGGKRGQTTGSSGYQDLAIVSGRTSQADDGGEEKTDDFRLFNQAVMDVDLIYQGLSAVPRPEKITSHMTKTEVSMHATSAGGLDIQGALTEARVDKYLDEKRPEEATSAQSFAIRGWVNAKLRGAVGHGTELVRILQGEDRDTRTTFAGSNDDEDNIGEVSAGLYEAASLVSGRQGNTDEDIGKHRRVIAGGKWQIEWLTARLVHRLGNSKFDVDPLTIARVLATRPDLVEDLSEAPNPKTGDETVYDTLGEAVFEEQNDESSPEEVTSRIIDAWIPITKLAQELEETSSTPHIWPRPSETDDEREGIIHDELIHLRRAVDRGAAEYIEDDGPEPDLLLDLLTAAVAANFEQQSTETGSDEIRSAAVADGGSAREKLKEADAANPELANAFTDVVGGALEDLEGELKAVNDLEGLKGDVAVALEEELSEADAGYFAQWDHGDEENGWFARAKRTYERQTSDEQPRRVHSPIADAILEYPQEDADLEGKSVDDVEAKIREHYTAAQEVRDAKEDLETALARQLAAHYLHNRPNEVMPELKDIESTYVKLKNGADESGDATAAGEFFYKEKEYLRRQHKRKMLSLNDDRDDVADSVLGRLNASFSPRDGGKWAANELMRVTIGYGERPARTIGVAGIIIIAGAVAHYIADTGNELRYDWPGIPESLGGVEIMFSYVLASLQSFVTFVMAGVPGAADGTLNPWVRLVAQVEGFFGITFVAVLVFVLTRSIHR